MPVKNGLPAIERIKSRKLFEALVQQGDSIWQPPFRLTYIPLPFDELNPVLFAVSAPKRKMKHAHDRNRMKRLIREAYRLNKHALIANCRTKKRSFAILFISQNIEPISFDETQEKIILLLHRLNKVNDKPSL
jgi:ribonuclease P protein component